MPHKVRCGPLDHRHPAVREALRDLESDHLPEHLAVISREIENAAHSIVARVNDGPRLTAGLNLLVQAKDALVRQAVRDAEEPTSNESPAVTARTAAQTTRDQLDAARAEIPIAGMQRSMTEDEIRLAIGED